MIRHFVQLCNDNASFSFQNSFQKLKRQSWRGKNILPPILVTPITSSSKHLYFRIPGLHNGENCDEAVNTLHASCNLFLSYQKVREKSNIRERFSLILQKNFSKRQKPPIIWHFLPTELLIGRASVPFPPSISSRTFRRQRGRHPAADQSASGWHCG